ncbi:anion permease [Halobacteriovorax sp. BALOs_7]|nr:anion permease [Halobacteriovorax sp. BALOs_7]
MSEWWIIGFIISIVNIAIWMTVDGIWWKFLGLY